MGAIDVWLQYHSHRLGDDNINWVALDDAYYGSEHPHKRFVNVNPYEGLSFENYRQATRILGKPDESVIAF